MSSEGRSSPTNSVQNSIQSTLRTSAMDSKLEFRPKDVNAFQLLADEFCDVYCGLTGRDGTTNYVHILRTGPFKYFLEKYGNLYLLLQQGG